MDGGTKVSKTLQTSLVVDPPDGRIPPLTPETQKRLALEAQALTEKCAQPGVVCPFNIGGRPILADGPEDRPLMERCISRVQGGPPMLPGPYNNNYHIVQNRDFVLIFVEQMHEARVIPLDGRPHLAPDIRELMGDPRGHWEGNTLVVDSTNFSDETRFRNAGRNMHLIERFTRTDPDTVLYEYTVDDPSNYTKPWSAAIPMAPAKGPLLEDECHEGIMGWRESCGRRVPKRRRKPRKRRRRAPLGVDKFSNIILMTQYRWIAFTGGIGIAAALWLHAAKTDGMSVMTGAKAFTNTASLSPGLARKITAQDLPPPATPALMSRLVDVCGCRCWPERQAAREGNSEGSPGIQGRPLCRQWPQKPTANPQGSEW